jgi:hypothetical protein
MSGWPCHYLQLRYLTKQFNKDTADLDPTPSWIEEVDHLTEPVWALNSSNSHDFLDIIFLLMRLSLRQ